MAAGGVTGFSNCMSTAVDALLRTFLMTVNEFMSFYADLAACNVLLPQIIGKVIFNLIGCQESVIPTAVYLLRMIFLILIAIRGEGFDVMLTFI